MKKIVIEGKSKDGGHYSAGVVHGGILYVSGQLSIDPNSERPSGNIEEEATVALRNLETVLMAAGVSKKDVIQCRLYTPNVEYWNVIDRVYRTFFGEHKPSRIVVPSNTLHGGCLVEIEAIAICEEV